MAGEVDLGTLLVKIGGDLTSLLDSQKKVENVLGQIVSKSNEATHAISKHAEEAGAGYEHLNESIQHAIGRVKELAEAYGALKLGEFAFEAAEEVDRAMARIRGTTGVTGEALAAMGESARKIWTEVPQPIGDVATVLSALKTRLDETGPGADAVAKSLLDLSRVTGSDVNTTVTESTRIFQGYQVALADQIPANDLFLRATQASGASLGTLQGALASAGPALRGFGFSLDQSTALFVLMEKRGIDAGSALGSLSRALRNATKDGGDAQATFFQIIHTIQNAKTDAEATKVAFEVFGRSAAGMADLIRHGNFDINAMVELLHRMPDTVASAGEATKTFGDEWNQTMNQLKAAIAPLGEVIVKMGEELLPILRDDIIPVLHGVSEAIAMLPPEIPLTIALLGLGKVVEAVLSAGALGGLLKVLGLTRAGAVAAASEVGILDGALVSAAGEVAGVAAVGTAVTGVGEAAAAAGLVAAGLASTLKWISGLGTIVLYVEIVPKLGQLAAGAGTWLADKLFGSPGDAARKSLDQAGFWQGLLHPGVTMDAAIAAQGASDTRAQSSFSILPPNYSMVAGRALGPVKPGVFDPNAAAAAKELAKAQEEVSRAIDAISAKSAALGQAFDADDARAKEFASGLTKLVDKGMSVGAATEFMTSKLGSYETLVDKAVESKLATSLQENATKAQLLGAAFNKSDADVKSYQKAIDELAAKFPHLDQASEATRAEFDKLSKGLVLSEIGAAVDDARKKMELLAKQTTLTGETEKQASGNVSILTAELIRLAAIVPKDAEEANKLAIAIKNTQDQLGTEKINAFNVAFDKTLVQMDLLTKQNWGAATASFETESEKRQRIFQDETDKLKLALQEQLAAQGINGPAQTAIVEKEVAHREALYQSEAAVAKKAMGDITDATYSMLAKIAGGFLDGSTTWKSIISDFKQFGISEFEKMFVETMKSKVGTLDSGFEGNLLHDIPGMFGQMAKSVLGIFGGLWDAILGQKGGFDNALGNTLSNFLGGGSGGGGITDALGKVAQLALQSGANGALGSAGLSALGNVGTIAQFLANGGTFVGPGSALTVQEAQIMFPNGQIPSNFVGPTFASTHPFLNAGVGFAGGIGGGFLGSYIGQQLGGRTGGAIGGLGGGLLGQYLATTYGPQVAAYLAGGAVSTAAPVVAGAATTAAAGGLAASSAAAAANAVNIVPGIGTAIALIIHAAFTAVDVAKGKQSLMGAQINESVDPLGLLGMLGINPAKILGQGLTEGQVARRGLSGLLQGTQAFGDLPKLTESAQKLVGEFKNGNSIFERTDDLLKQYPKLSGDALAAGSAFAFGVGGAIKTPLGSGLLASSATMSDLIARLGQGGITGKDAIGKIQHATVELGVTSGVQLNAIVKLLDKGKISADQFAKAMKGIDIIGVDQGTDKGAANTADLRAKQVQAIQLEFAKGKVTFEEYIKLLNEIETTAVNTFDGVGIAVDANLGKLSKKTGVSAAAIHTVFDVLKKDGITSLDAFGSASSDTLKQLEVDLGGAGSEGEKIFQALAAAGVLNFTDMANLSKPQIQAIIDFLNLIPKEIRTKWTFERTGDLPPDPTPQFGGVLDPNRFRPGGGFILPPPPHAAGLAYVPHDNYFASLHRGEAVIPSAEMPILRQIVGGRVSASDGISHDPEIKQILQQIAAAVQKGAQVIVAPVMDSADLARFTANAKRTGHIVPDNRSVMVGMSVRQ